MWGCPVGVPRWAHFVNILVRCLHVVNTPVKRLGMEVYKAHLAIKNNAICCKAATRSSSREDDQVL